MSVHPSEAYSQLYPVPDGYINSAGKLVLRLSKNTYCPRPFSEGVGAVRFIDGRKAFEPNLGYVGRTGEFVIPPRFLDKEGLEGAENFSEGLAVATLPGVRGKRNFPLYGYTDRTGEMVIAPKFHGARAFSDGIAVVAFFTKFSRFALINKQGGIIFEHPQAYEAYDASEGLAAVRIDELWGFVDATGRLVIEPQFLRVGRFSHGLAPAMPCESNRPGNYFPQFGYIDRTGQFVIQPQFDAAESFSEGLAAVKVGAGEYGAGGQWGYIDTAGHFAIPPQFQDTLHTASRFSEGLAAITIPDWRFGYNGKAGYIDRTGQFVIPPQFNSGAGPFTGGLADVGVMFEQEVQGEPIPNPPPGNPSVDQIRDMLLSIDRHKGSSKFGYINKQGQFVWEDYQE